MERVNLCQSGLQYLADDSQHNPESSSRVRAVNPGRRKLQSKAEGVSPAHMGKDSYDIKPVRDKSDIHEKTAQKFDWNVFFYEFPYFPGDVVPKLNINKSTRENIYKIYDMFDKGCYNNVIKLCEPLIAKLNGVQHSDSILKYIKSVKLISEIKFFSEELENLTPECSFPIIPGFSTFNNYVDFLFNLAEAAKSGDGVIGQSADFEWFCYRKAAESGSNKAKIIVIERMLFGEVDSAGEMVNAPQCVREALEQIKLYITIDEDCEYGRYSEVISHLEKCLVENNSGQQTTLSEYLLKEPRSEVRCLAPMAFLEPMFGQVNTSSARVYIDKLCRKNDASMVVEYWRCVADLLDRKNEVLTKKKLLVLGAQGFLEAYLLLLRCYQVRHDFLATSELIKIYQECDTFSPALACMMFRLSYLADQDEAFRGHPDVYQAIARARVFACLSLDAVTTIDILFENSRAFFSREHWQKAWSSEACVAPKQFRALFSRDTFSDSPQFNIFRHAYQSISGLNPDDEVLQRAKSLDLPKSLYWMIVLNHCPKDTSMTDLVHDFLEESRDGLSCIIPFMHTSSLTVFLEKLYQYGAFSERSKNHPVFNVDSLAQLASGLNGRINCLNSLVKLKELNNQPGQAAECMRVIQEFSVAALRVNSAQIACHDLPELIEGFDRADGQNKILYGENVGFDVLRRDLPKWKIRCYALLAQQNHPLGDVYRFNDLFRLIEGFDPRSDLLFSSDFIAKIMSCLYGAKYFLEKEALLTVFLNLGRMLRQFEGDCRVRVTKTCQVIISWLDKIDGTIFVDHIQSLRACTENTRRRSVELTGLLVQDFTELIENHREISDHRSESESDSIKGNDDSSQSSESSSSDDDSSLEEFSSILYPVESNWMRALRDESDHDRCFKLLRKLINLDFSDSHELVEQAIKKLDPKKIESIILVRRILEDINKELEDGVVLFFGFNSQYVFLLQQAIDHSAAEGRSFPELEEILYKKLSYMALYDLVSLKHLHTDLGDKPPDYYKLLELMAVGLKCNVKDQMEMLVTGKSADARALLAFARTQDQDKITSIIQVLQPEIDASGFSPGMNFSVLFMKLWVQHDHAELRRVVETRVRGNHHDVSKASSALWVAYEFGVISVEQHTSMMTWIDKRSPEYYFHSLLTEDDPEASIFIGLRSEQKLAALTVPQLETVARKLVEAGRVSDAQWLARTQGLSAFEEVLSLSAGSDRATSDRVADDFIEVPVENLIAGAKSGRCQAQCKLVEWILAKREQWHAEPMQHLQNICSFAIHTPGFLTDSCRLLYQGIALCAGIAGYKEPEAGKIKIRTALDSHDPASPLILHKMISRFPWLDLPYRKEDLLRIFLEYLPEAEVCSAKLITEILLVAGDVHFRQAVKEMAEESGLSANPDSPGGLKVRALSCWFDKWSEQTSYQNRSPVQKLIYHFGVQVRTGWPVQNLNTLRDKIERSGQSDLYSDDFQRELIFYVKRLIRLSDTHKVFAGFLCDHLLPENRHGLLLNDRRGKKLYWDSPVFERDNKWVLFRSMPVSYRYQLLLSLVKEINSRGELPVHAGAKRNVDQKRMPAILVQEFIKETESRGLEYTEAALANRIRSVIKPDAKKYKYYELLKYLLLIDRSGLNPDERQAFQETIRNLARDSLKGQVNIKNEGEVLSMAAIYTLT